nr:hypothetical protein Iba_chr10aCG15240 [Ipomoea batatas]
MLVVVLLVMTGQWSSKFLSLIHSWRPLAMHGQLEMTIRAVLASLSRSNLMQVVEYLGLQLELTF